MIVVGMTAGELGAATVAAVVATTAFLPAAAAEGSGAHKELLAKPLDATVDQPVTAAGFASTGPAADWCATSEVQRIFGK